VKKIYFSAALLLLLAAGLAAKPAPDYYLAKYELMDLDFLRTHYFEINNGRQIQFEGRFSSFKWIPPFQYKERLGAIGFNVNQYHLLQFTLKEIEGGMPVDLSMGDNVHYSFPILMFHTQAGDLTEFDQLNKGDRVVIYGRFYNLKKSEYVIEADLFETIKKGGHDRDLLLDSRVAPTPTPTPTVTPTPGPNVLVKTGRFTAGVWKKVSNMVNAKETVTPTGSVTPEVTVTATPKPKK
jgi:hypothetical protein